MSTNLPPELARWFDAPVAEDFPYLAVVSEFHRGGKQHVPRELLEALARARSVVAEHEPLVRFLDVALDKYDERYDYTSYLAIELFPTPNDEVADRVITHLVIDSLAFELAALDGADVPFPRMRPDERTVAKRCRHGLRTIAPPLSRIGGTVVSGGDHLTSAREVTAWAREHRSEEDTHLLRTTMLPVDTIHDEYQFIRVLQAFETLFAVTARGLASVPRLLREGDVQHAVLLLDGLANRFEETAPLFSMLATMRVESFREFRTNTEGASAIQSNNYKRLESLCSRPAPDRLASLAYESVPVVRDEILSGRLTVDDALTELDLEPDEAALVDRAKRRFAEACGRWRRTHYGLAARMLDGKTGTGYTAGVPYLADIRDIPMFKTCPRSPRKPHGVG